MTENGNVNETDLKNGEGAEFEVPEKMIEMRDDYALAMTHLFNKKAKVPTKKALAKANKYIQGFAGAYGEDIGDVGKVKEPATYCEQAAKFFGLDSCSEANELKTDLDKQKKEVAESKAKIDKAKAEAMY